MPLSHEELQQIRAHLDAAVPTPADLDRARSRRVFSFQSEFQADPEIYFETPREPDPVIPEGTVAETPDGRRLVFKNRAWQPVAIPEPMHRPTVWEHLNE